MKSLSHFLACIGALGLLSVGCERHDFEKTKILHMEHGGDHHEGEHKEGHEGDSQDAKGHSDEGEHAKEEKEGKTEAKPEKEEGRDVGI